MKIQVGDYFRNLKLVHRVMLIMNILCSVLFAVIINVASPKLASTEALHNIMKYIIIAIALICYVGSNYYFAKKINLLNNSIFTLAYRLTAYRSASIIRWTLVEMPLIISNILLFITGSYYYIIYIFILLLFFIMYTPSKLQVMSYLNLSPNEQTLLDDDYNEIEG